MVVIILNVWCILLSITSFIPLINKGFWIVKGFDFPRLQCFLAILATLIIKSIWYTNNYMDVIVLIILIIAAILDIYRIFPYTPFAKIESVYKEDGIKIRIMTSNVRTQNKNYNQLLSLISEVKPDVLFLVETDKIWQDQLEKLQETYPFTIFRPQDNTYGMLLYSKLKLSETEIKFMIDDNVPSIHARVHFNEELSFKLAGIHPRPPRPKEGDSDQRDGELMKVAKIAKSEEHFIVLGDFNDVAWSHTTRLFKKVSGLLDPRVGRGFFNTFPVWLSPMRVPLDHMFHSRSFFFHSLSRLRDIGSDHFPILAEFIFDPNDKQKNSEQKSNQVDKKEAQELEKRGDQWDGPNEEVEKDDD